MELKKTIKLLKSLNNVTIVISSNLLNVLENLCTKLLFINNGKMEKIKIMDNPKRKIVTFEVDDFSKAKLLIKDYCINDDLSVYETDDKISELNKELLLNNINVYRIYESNNFIENEFISKSN
jgi:ABC-type multidrug transport system ATPase subunit